MADQPTSTPAPPASDENPFDAPLASEGGAAPSATTPDQGNPFEEPLESEKAAEGGPDDEEKQFLKENPDHEYLKQDSKFPNRPEGIYPKGPGNEWRKDPSYSQSPVDLHLAKHTAEGAAAGATVAGLAMASPLAAPALAHIAKDFGKPAVEAIKAAAASHPLVAKLIGHALETVSGITIAKYMNLFGKK